MTAASHARDAMRNVMRHTKPLNIQHLAFGACLLSACASASVRVAPSAAPQSRRPLSMQDGVDGTVVGFPGLWRDQDTGAEATVEASGGGFAVTSVIDDDGEVYVVMATSWEDPRLRWAIHVPSTGYDVAYDCRHDVAQGLLRCDWAGTAGHGEVTFHRSD